MLMIHEVELCGKSFKVSFSCTHPKLRDNTCPFNDGDCAECGYCEATMKAEDYFEIQAMLWDYTDK